MKESMEYRILKYLKQNNKGLFIDISDIENDKCFLKNSINELKERRLIDTEPYPSIPWTNIDFIGSTPSEKPDKCKITLLGIEYLFNLKKSKVDFELAEKMLKEYPKTKWFARIGAFIGICLAILELIKWLM